MLLEALTKTHSHDGESLPARKAVSIDLGVVEDVGFVAEDTKLASLLKSMGHLSITGPEILVLLEYYCDRAGPVLSPLQSQLLTCLQLPSTLRAHKVTESPFLAQSMFRPLHQIRTFEEASSSALRDLGARNLKTDFSKADSLAEGGDLVCDLFREKLSGMLVIEKGDIDPRKPLHTYGVDSLGAMEIRNWLSVTMTADLAVFEVLGNGSMGELSKEVASRSGIVPKSLKAEDGDVKQHVEE